MAIWQSRRALLRCSLTKTLVQVGDLGGFRLTLFTMPNGNKEVVEHAQRNASMASLFFFCSHEKHRGI